MYICSICRRAFIQEENPVYTTPCGHIFHQQCLVPWINRHKNCPQCGSKVSVKRLIKLFFEIDSSLELKWNKQGQEQLNSLRNELKAFDESENPIQITNVLEAEHKKLKQAHRSLKASNQALRLKSNNYKAKVNQLEDRLVALNLDYNQINDKKTTLESDILLKRANNRSLTKRLYGLQSQNSVVIEKLKCEIADLKEKTSFLEKCSSQKRKNLTYALKEYIANDINTSYEIECDKKNLKLKLSCDKIFLGCVFLIVENRYWYEYTRFDTSKCQQNIIDHGGLIVLSYSPSVTHLICITQKNPIVQRGIKDRKRCVTDNWVIDVIAEHKMLPPWLAHHFPAPYNEEIGLPCHNFEIGVFNFDVNKYRVVKTMVEFTGGRVVDEVSPDSLIAVSLTLEGQQVERAQAINIPVVNVKWLSDIIFGAQVDLINPKNYKKFDLRDPYTVTYNMISHLMEAWKTHIPNGFQMYDVANILGEPMTENSDPIVIDDSD